jgi:hypothetical protein
LHTEVFSSLGGFPAFLDQQIQRLKPAIFPHPNMANIGTATLDRLVASKRVPSVLVGTHPWGPIATSLFTRALPKKTDDLDSRPH